MKSLLCFFNKKKKKCLKITKIRTKDSSMIVKCNVARILYHPYKFPTGQILSLSLFFKKRKPARKNSATSFAEGWYAPPFRPILDVTPFPLPSSRASSRAVDRRGRAYLSFCQASGEKRRRSCGMLMYNAMVLSCTLNCRPAEFFPLEEGTRGGEGRRG